MSILNHWRYRHILATLEDSLNLQRRASRGRTIGDQIANIIAYGIIINTNKGRDPDGKRLAPLSKRYLRWKIRHGFNPAILHQTDHMMSFQQVKGIVVISKDAMTMFYGLDPWAQKKAEYAHEGKVGGKSGRTGVMAMFSNLWDRPPREFYGIDKETDKDIEAFCDKEIDALIMSLGATRRP